MLRIRYFFNRYYWVVVVIFVYFCEMLSKMMKDQPKDAKFGITKKKEDQEADINMKKSFSTNEQMPVNEQKRMKSNHKTGNGPHVTSITNWEKFKDIIKDDNKDKTKTHMVRPFSRQKRNYNNVGSPTSVTSSFQARTSIENTKENKTMEKKRNLLSKQVAMDCEMVGIGDGTDSMLARVSIVNKYGDCVYDKYVKPREKILDYRTAVSGIRPHHLHNGEDFEIVQREVADILNGRILVGHALKHDTDVLFLSHPRRMIRDTSRYKQFRKVSKGNTPSLKKLAFELLGIDIQTGEHNSVEDARTAMQLYMLYKNQWEMDIRNKR